WTRRARACCRRPCRPGRWRARRHCCWSIGRDACAPAISARSRTWRWARKSWPWSRSLMPASKRSNRRRHDGNRRGKLAETTAALGEPRPSRWADSGARRRAHAANTLGLIEQIAVQQNAAINVVDVGMAAEGHGEIKLVVDDLEAALD